MLSTDYVTVNEGKSQYGDDPIKEPVEARYIHALDPEDAGNPLIEALPLPREGKETLRAYTKSITEYDPEKACKLTRLEQILQIRKLREVRVPLPFHQLLEDEFYCALLDSYRRRDLVPTDEDQTCVVKDQEVPCGNVLISDPSEATYGLFSLTGFGGSGKSSAIHTLTKRYPQAIIHADGRGGYFTQIVYLVVTCKPNGNLGSLFDSVGDAVDKALRNTRHTNLEKVKNQRDVGKKAEAVEELIETFSIGAITFDEIQLLNDGGRSKHSSLSYLLDIMNTEKLAMIYVGTQDANESLFPELHTARRTGVMINASTYCADKSVFSMLTCRLFRYQWCPSEKRVAVPEKNVQLSKEDQEKWDDIVDTLYDLTKGIVDNLVTMYSRAWLDYIDRPKDHKPKIDGEYFKKIANKYYPGIQDILKRMDLEGLFSLNKNVKDDMEAQYDAEAQKAQADLILTESDQIVDEQLMHDRVFANFEGMDGIDMDDVEKAYQEVIKSKEAQGQNDVRLTIMVTQRLQKTAKRTKKNKVPKKDLENFDSSLEDSVLIMDGGSE